MEGTDWRIWALTAAQAIILILLGLWTRSIDSSVDIIRQDIRDVRQELKDGVSDVRRGQYSGLDRVSAIESHIKDLERRCTWIEGNMYSTGSLASVQVAALMLMPN